MSSGVGESPVESRCRIFLIRHGESEANVAELIVSDPKNGVSSFGLTDKGRQQAAQVSQRLQELCGPTLPSNLVIISSDFKRARETAEIIHQQLKPPFPLQIDQRLRERSFGSLENTHASNYQKVWSEDTKSGEHTSYGCESVSSVYSRTSELVTEVEQKWKGRVVVLVSHGDTCKITLTAYRGLAPHEHWQLPCMGNCELIELHHSPDQ